MWLLEMTWIDWVGVLGSVFIAGAYWAVTWNLVNPDRPPFNFLNLFGAILILFSLYFEPVPGAIMIELFWILIASTALIRYYLTKRRA